LKVDKSFIIESFTGTNDVDPHSFSLNLENCRINSKGHIISNKATFEINNEVYRLNNNKTIPSKVYLFDEIKDIVVTNGGELLAPPRDPNYSPEVYTKLIIGIKADDDRLDIYTCSYSDNDKTMTFEFKRTLEGTFDRPVSFKQFYRYYFIANGNDKIIAMQGDGELASFEDDEAVPIGSCLEEYKNYLFCAGDPKVPNQIVLSDLNNGLAWSGKDDAYENFFNVGNDDTDAIVGLKSFNDKLYIFKEKSIWVLQGYSYDSFQVYKISDTGAINNSAIEILNSALYFIGSDYMLYKMTDTITNVSYGKVDVENLLIYVYYADQDKMPFLCIDNDFVYIGYDGEILYMYDTLKNIFIKATNIYFDKIIKTKIIANKYFNIGINKNGLRIIVNEDKDRVLIQNIYINIDNYSERYTTKNPRIILKFSLTDDNLEKLIKYFYMNLYREDTRSCTLSILHDDKTILNKNITEKFEIDELFRMPLLQIKKEIDVYLYLSGGEQSYLSSNSFTLKKMGFLYNNRRRKYGLVK